MMIGRRRGIVAWLRTEVDRLRTELAREDHGDVTAARERIAEVTRDGDIGAIRRALDPWMRRQR